MSNNTILGNIEPQYYKHKYGGIYCLLSDAKNKSNNDEIMVIYEHVYPFEKAVYVRNKDEFYNSNIPLTKEQLNVELSKPIDVFQREITDKKNKKM
jgi:hypothetical protein